jgi:CBS domain-containing protein
MQAESNQNLLVEDALETVQYRVYPETPLREVVDLMVRRGVRALPVVGEQYEVLGIITTSDALGDMLSGVLRERPAVQAVTGSEDEQRTARDIMTRAVLCVSEAQPLVDAARIMVTRSVEQLPVVREGELIGLVTRDATLRALHEGSRHANDETEDDS